MSTRSTIAIENENGTIKKVYCHYDGYISHVGKVLANQYSDPALWRELCYGKDIRGFSTTDINGVFFPERFDRPDDTPFWPDEYANYAEYVASIDHVFHEYNYIMRKDGSMEVIENNYKNPSKAKAKSLKRCVAKLPKETA